MAGLAVHDRQDFDSRGTRGARDLGYDRKMLRRKKGLQSTRNKYRKRKTISMNKDKTFNAFNYQNQPNHYSFLWKYENNAINK